MAVLKSGTTIGGYTAVHSNNISTYALTSVPANVITTSGGQTIAGTTYFSGGESMQFYGARGRFTNEYMHLYNKVGVGNPNGWGVGEGNTPAYGLSTYGGAIFAYGNGATSSFNGHLRIDRNWAQGDYGAEQFTIRGTYPSIALRSTQHNSKWLIHNDDTLSFYYGGPVDDNSWARKFFIPTDGNIWMSWAGDYISNLLGAKQNASTAITTSNIGSQSVSYASSAGSVAWGNVSSKPSYIMYYQGFTLNANTMDSNSTGFTYANNAPFYGPIARFSTGGGYDLWLGGDYTSGTAFYLRTRNGDNGTFNAWKEIIHSGNIGSQSVNYAASAGSVDGLTINNSGNPINPDNVTQNQIGYNNSVSLFGQSDGGLYSSAYSSSWIHQIYGDFRTGQIAIRGKNSGTWQDWRLVLDEKNIGSYAVPYGNMTSSTGLNDKKLYLRTNGDNNHYLWNAGDDWEELNAYEGTGFRVTSNAGGTGLLYVYGASNGGYTYSPYSFRAPIFYDSNDTTYYLDPNAGTSLKIAGGIVTTAGSGAVLLKHSNSEANSWIFQEAAANWGLFWFNAGSQSGQTIGSYTTVGAELFGMNNAVTGYNPNSAWSGTDGNTRAAWMLSNYSGYLWTQGTQYSQTDMRAPEFRLTNSNNNASITGGGDWGLAITNDNGYIRFGPANNSWSHIYSDKNFYMNTHLWVSGGYKVTAWDYNNGGGSLYANVFYDAENTGYYLDPNSTSYLYHLVLSGNSYFRPNTWIQFDGNYGIYWPNHYGLHIYPNNDGSYGSLQVKGSKNSWHGIHFDSGNTLMSNANEAGFHQQGVGWKFRWYNGEMYISSGSTGGGTERTVIHSGNIGSQSVSYASSAGRSSALDIVGYGSGNMTYYQTSGTFAGYSGWAGYFVSNHGDGATYYNQTIIMPFWGPPQYSRLQGGTFAGPYTFWSTENLNDYAPNMNQYVRTSDNVTFNTTTSPTILVNNHSDNTKGYRIHNTSGSSVSAMFTNSSNQLVIAAGAVDQINLNKKVYVNGVALGVNVTPSATAGRIDASNDIVAYSSSDERLKHNITPIENALDKVKSLTGVEFDWKPEYKQAHGYEGHDTGIIAQQVQAVIPSAVRTNDTGFLAVRYEKLIGLLIEANKELAARVEELEKKLN